MIYPSSRETENSSPDTSLSSGSLSVCSGETAIMGDTKPEVKRCLSVSPDFVDQETKVAEALDTLIDPTELDFESMRAKYFAFLEAENPVEPLHLFYDMVTTQRDESLPVVCYAAELYRKTKAFVDVLKKDGAKEWVDNNGMMSLDTLCSLMTQAMLLGRLPSKVQESLTPYLGHDKDPATYTAVAEREIRKIGAVAVHETDRSNPLTGKSTPTRLVPFPLPGPRPSDTDTSPANDARHGIDDGKSPTKTKSDDEYPKPLRIPFKTCNDKQPENLNVSLARQSNEDLPLSPDKGHLERSAGDANLKIVSYESTKDSSLASKHPVSHSTDGQRITKDSSLTAQSPMSRSIESVKCPLESNTTLPNQSSVTRKQMRKNPPQHITSNDCRVSSSKEPHAKQITPTKYQNDNVKHYNDGSQGLLPSPEIHRILFVPKPNQCHRCLGLHHSQADCISVPYCPYHKANGHSWRKCQEFAHLAKRTQGQINLISKQKMQARKGSMAMGHYNKYNF